MVFLEAAYFLVPGALANMAPVIFKKINFLNYPLDFNLKFFDGERILGEHKTFRGLFFAIIFGIIGVYLQKMLFNIDFFHDISFINYSSANILLLGFLSGFGVMLGDAFGSFFKRRLKIAPGKEFMPVDQIDSPIFLILVLLPFYSFSFWFMFWAIIVWVVGHLIVNYIGWLIKIKKNKF